VSEDQTGKIVRFEDDFMALGFTMVPNAVLLNGRLSNGAVRLYAQLAFYARQSDECWPGQARLANMMGASDRTIRTYLRELETVGLVKTQRRGLRMTNVYTLCTPGDDYVKDVVRQQPSGLGGPERQPTSALTGEQLPERPDADFRQKKTQGEEDTGEEVLGAGAPGDGQQSLLPSLPVPPQPIKGSSDDVFDTTGGIHRIWKHWLATFPDAHRVTTLTPARERTIRKALTAVDGQEDVCIRAITGLKTYIEADKSRNQKVELSRIFETGPQSRSNLTDQIEWWADQATSATDVAHPEVPSVLRDRINQRRLTVVHMHQQPDNASLRDRGEQALRWLAQHANERPIVTDGKVTGWEGIQ
jgi:hypothetical protein